MFKISYAEPICGRHWRLRKAGDSPSPGKKLGVAWWLFPDESHNADGGHREYLKRSNAWKRFDPDLFEALLKIEKGKERDVRVLENPALLPNAVFAGDPVPCGARPFAKRPDERRLWLRGIQGRFKDRDLLFFDPDNGIASEGLRPTQRRAGKSAFIGEIKELKESHRAIVIYHHHSMFKGGHEAALRSLAGRLNEGGFRVSGALRAKPWSPRAFFILDGDDELCTRAKDIEKNWDGWIKWHSGVSLGLGG